MRPSMRSGTARKFYAGTVGAEATTLASTKPLENSWARARARAKSGSGFSRTGSIVRTT